MRDVGARVAVVFRKTTTTAAAAAAAAAADDDDNEPDVITAHPGHLLLIIMGSL